jgi:hypothetical protein
MVDEMTSVITGQWCCGKGRLMVSCGKGGQNAASFWDWFVVAMIDHVTE